MKTKWNLLAVALIAGGTMFAQPRVSIGIGVGGYGPGAYPPPVYAQAYVPPCPGPGYAWVDGYWVPQGGRNVWVAGFWRAPYVAPYRVAPRYETFRAYDRDDHRRDWDRGRDHVETRGREFGNGFRR